MTSSPALLKPPAGRPWSVTDSYRRRRHDRRQQAKQYWPIKRASNKRKATAGCENLVPWLPSGNKDVAVQHRVRGHCRRLRRTWVWISCDDCRHSKCCLMVRAWSLWLVAVLTLSLPSDNTFVCVRTNSPAVRRKGVAAASTEAGIATCRSVQG